MLSLRALGWTEARSRDFELVRAREPETEPGRVIAVHRGTCVVDTGAGDVRAALAGHARDAEVLPAVGDWVALRRTGDAALVRSILPRSGTLSRKVAGAETKEHVLVANVDVALVVTALDRDFNLRRLERYLATVYAGGARPVVALTKADVADDPGLRVIEAEAVAPGVEVIATSVVTGEGIGEVAALARPAVTLALLGSSGVGKSSLVNTLAGAPLHRVRDVRGDGKGRHTTTHRELVVLPSGGLVVDTPGLRELQLWDAGGGVDAAFADVAALAGSCRFSDCSHRTEPGCAVAAAVVEGTLDPERVAAYHKLQRELAYLERRQDRRARAEETRRWRAVARAARRRSR